MAREQTGVGSSGDLDDLAEGMGSGLHIMRVAHFHLRSVARAWADESTTPVIRSSGSWLF